MLLFTGLVFAVMALVGLVGIFVAPGLASGDSAGSNLRLTAIVWAIGFGTAAAILLYIAWPSDRGRVAPGSRKAKATITSVKPLPADVSGYPLVELGLDVTIKGQTPYSVTRKFVAQRFTRLEPGQVIDVRVDPANPEKVELG
jgi:hypothetical protein